MKLEIDYGSHPAFKGLQRGAHSPEIAQYFAALDAAWLEAISSKADPDAASARFFEVAASELSKILPVIAAATDPSYRGFVTSALRTSAEMIAKEIVCVSGSRRSTREAGGAAGSVAEKLRHASIAGFRMDPTMRREISESLQPYMEQLRAQSRTNEGARCFVAVPAWGKHWDLLKQFLKANAIEEGISAYAGYPLELSGYALTYSHPEETWFRQCYADLGLKAPKTVQMHFDEENTSAKSMFYLNEIESDNGPFSYIPRKMLEVPSRSQLSYFKYLDFAHAEFADVEGEKPRLYNRALFSSARLRPHFARLPVELQGSSCLGDDLLDGSPLCESLFQCEQQITSAVGDLALFAGGETLHRGGIVSKGERWALQMIYKPPLSFKARVKQKATSVLLGARNRFREVAG